MQKCFPDGRQDLQSWNTISVLLLFLDVVVSLINPVVPNAPFLYALFSGGRERVHWERMG